MDASKGGEDASIIRGDLETVFQRRLSYRDLRLQFQWKRIDEVKLTHR